MCLTHPGLTPFSSASPLSPRYIPSPSRPERLTAHSSVVSLRAHFPRADGFHLQPVPGGFAGPVVLDWRRPMAWQVGTGTMARAGRLPQPAALPGELLRESPGIRGAQTAPSLNNSISHNTRTDAAPYNTWSTKHPERPVPHAPCRN